MDREIMQAEQFIFHRVVSLQNDEDVDESNLRCL